MPDFKEILEQHKDVFQGMEGIDEQFTTLSTKLNELGYDVLINNKQKAEFIPAGRLNEVVAQRDQFKTQVAELNKQLEAMKSAAEGNEALQKQLQEQIDNNNKLMEQMEQTRIEAEILLAAKDANDPKDVLMFINKEVIKVDKRTGQVSGIQEEIERIKKEKPYLFNKTASKAGVDPNEDESGKETNNMNFMIRRAAGRI